MPDKVKKYTECIEKAPETKVLMQSISFDICVYHYSIKILNLFNPELVN